MASGSPWVPPEQVLDEPDAWSVPREWPGERCFILGGGESLRDQRDLIPQLKGRVIAIKQAVALRPDAEVMFMSGKRAYELCAPFFPLFKGRYKVARGRVNVFLPRDTKRIGRTKDHTRLCDLPTHVAGYDAGTSAINLAYHFGATEIVLLGYDMCGGRWFNGEYPHFQPYPPQLHFDRHMAILPDIAADCRAKGIRVVNCSPISKVNAFERQPLEAFL